MISVESSRMGAGPGRDEVQEVCQWVAVPRDRVAWPSERLEPGGVVQKEVGEDRISKTDPPPRGVW